MKFIHGSNMVFVRLLNPCEVAYHMISSRHHQISVGEEIQSLESRDGSHLGLSEFRLNTPSPKQEATLTWKG